MHKQHQDIHVTFAFNILLQFHHTKFSTRGFKHIPVKFSYSPHLPTCHLRIRHSPYSIRDLPLNTSEYDFGYTDNVHISAILIAKQAQ